MISGEILTLSVFSNTSLKGLYTEFQVTHWSQFEELHVQLTTVPLKTLSNQAYDMLIISF